MLQGFQRELLSASLLPFAGRQWPYQRYRLSCQRRRLPGRPGVAATGVAHECAAVRGALRCEPGGGPDALPVRRPARRRDCGPRGTVLPPGLSCCGCDHCCRERCPDCLWRRLRCCAGDVTVAPDRRALARPALYRWQELYRGQELRPERSSVLVVHARRPGRCAHGTGGGGCDCGGFHRCGCRRNGVAPVPVLFPLCRAPRQRLLPREGAVSGSGRAASRLWGWLPGQQGSRSVPARGERLSGFAPAVPWPQASVPPPAPVCGEQCLPPPDVAGWSVGPGFHPVRAIRCCIPPPGGS